MLFQRDLVRDTLRRLAEDHQVYLGTSSWKFPDWCGLLYDEERYLYRRRFSKARFERECLAEYALTFPAVEVDSTYYRRPRPADLAALGAQVPEGFRLSFKVPDDITVKAFPNLPAYGRRAGLTNDTFLDPAVCHYGFLHLFEPIRDQVGVFIFEFPHFHGDDFAHGRDFVTALDRFFAALPRDWDYAVEIRNKNLLHPDYFGMLERHGVAHVYNAWTHMPTVAEQMRMHPPEAAPFLVARFLLPEGRPHAWAQEKMKPFSRLYEVDPVSREAFIALLDHLTRSDHVPTRRSHLFLGNELEGCALHTIADILETWKAPRTGLPQLF